jgi:hypothetical protein
MCPPPPAEVTPMIQVHKIKTTIAGSFCMCRLRSGCGHPDTDNEVATTNFTGDVPLYAYDLGI